MRVRSFIHLLAWILVPLLIFSTCHREELTLLPEEEPVEESVIRDTQAPSVTIQNPTTEISLAISENTVTISGIASDDYLLNTISWHNNFNEDGIASGLENWNIPELDLHLGDNVIEVAAVDTAGNSNSDEIIITRNKYLTFLGRPSANPVAIYTNTTTPVIIRTSIAPNENLIPESVKLVLLDDNNNIIMELARMYDDGLLDHGDDIKDDGVFSTIHILEQEQEKLLRIRVTAKSQESGGEELSMSAVMFLGVYDKLSGNDYTALKNLQDLVMNKFKSNLDITIIEDAIDSTYKWLSQQSGVTDIMRISSGLSYELSSGIVAGLRIHETNEAGDIVTKGDGSYPDRKPKKSIPVYQQTRGNMISSIMGSEDYSDVIINKKILIWAPFEDVFPVDMRPTLEGIIEESVIPFQVTSIINADCDMVSLSNLTDYGLIVFDTHGSEGKEFGTGEIVTESNTEAHSLLIKSKQVGIWKDVVVSQNGDVTREEDIFCIRDPFISSLTGTFPNAIIFNGSCESTKNPDMKDAFLGKGAKTYFGFDEVVGVTFCRDRADEIVEGLVVDLETTDGCFVAGQVETGHSNAEFEMFGSRDMHYTVSLINGDFESADLTGCNSDGDGRVITKLGNLSPTEGQFMGIISTGLGFTTQKGEIRQAIVIPEGASKLTLNWNFLSEEFLEWVGSEFQDYFKITIRKSDGTELQVFQKSIDDFDSEYNLIVVSPDIVFDVGDVYMTGWQYLEFDLSALAGESIEIIFSSEDVGDSIFDSAILLDDIKIQ